MVFLSFTVLVKAPLPKVWDYFSKFENVAQWDPSSKSIKAKEIKENMIGTKYDVVTIFNGK